MSRRIRLQSLSFFFVGMLGGSIISRYIFPNTSLIPITSESNPQIVKEYHQTTQVDADFDNDGIEDEVVLTYIAQVDESEKQIICNSETSSKSCLDPYLSAMVTNTETFSTIAQSEDMKVTFPSNLRGEVFHDKAANYLFISGIGLGAHSSNSIVLKQNGEKLEIVCPENPEASVAQSEIGMCSLWSDEGGPFLEDLDGDRVPEYISLSRIYEGEFESVLSSVAYFDNGKMILATGDTYQRYYQLLSRSAEHPIISIDVWEERQRNN